MKRITLALTVIAASLALAASNTHVAQGNGAMRDASGNEFTFSMNVKQYTSDTAGSRPITFGSAFFRRNFVLNGNKYTMEYAMATAKAFQRVGTTATFEGAAKTNLYKNGVMITTTPGRLWASVSDMRAAGVPDGTPDSITFRFTAEDGNPPVQFSGPVLRGDIAVFEQANK